MSFVTSSRATLRRLIGDRTGASALEMALVMPILMLMLLGVIDIARYLFVVQSLRTVTAEAARMAMINHSLASSVEAADGNVLCTTNQLSSTNRALVAAKSPFINNSNLAVCITNPYSTGAASVTVTAKAEYKFSSIVPAVSWLSGHVTDQTRILYRNQ